MSESISFSRIRASAARVARDARFVRIDDAALEAFAGELASRAWPAPELDPAHHSLGDEETTAAFVVALDAINFGSGWFPHLRKRDGRSGYLTIAAALREHFEAKGALDAARLRSLDRGDVAEMLGQSDADADAQELMALFARALRDLGDWVAEQGGGSFAAAVARADRRAATLATNLAAMPLYRDVSRYEARSGEAFDVPLYKRAQITASDLAIAFEGRGLGAFEDIDELTMFADNLVPHVLRCRGVLVYEPSLARHIDAERTLEAGSPEEVEIRAVGLHAVEVLVGAIRARGRSATARALDTLLWTSGQDPAIKSRPRHRARSVFY